VLLGWYLDEISVFVFRTLLILIREYRSRTWPVTRAELLHSHNDESSLYPNVHFVYSYKIAGEPFTGTYTRGFWFSASAKEFHYRFLLAGYLLIRYRPNAPQESYIHRGDQRVVVDDEPTADSPSA
jgi:hypothetical protein